MYLWVYTLYLSSREKQSDDIFSYIFLLLKEYRYLSDKNKKSTNI